MRDSAWIVLALLGCGCSPTDIGFFQGSGVEASSDTTAGLRGPRTTQASTTQAATTQAATTQASTTGAATTGKTRAVSAATSDGGSGGVAQSAATAVGDAGAGGAAGDTGLDEGTSGATSTSSQGGAATGGTVDTEPPAIVQVTPADGASGVESTAVIVVQFNEPMDPLATASAYSSESLPADAVTSSWNPAGDELTITPKRPLSLAELKNPKQPALEYSFGFSSEATDLAGNPLEPATFGFTTLRRLALSIAAEREQSLSGARRSDDSPGVGSCAPVEQVVCGGDSVAAMDVQYFGFATFDTSKLPIAHALERAVLRAEIREIVGEPFDLGAFTVELVEFDAIGGEAMRSPALSTPETLALEGLPGDELSCDLTLVLASELDSDKVQLRFRFEEASDDDRAPDALIIDVDSLELEVVLLLE